MPYDINIREEELKNKITNDYFDAYDCTKIIGDVDFCVATPQNDSEIFVQQSLLWAEAKRGVSDIYKSLVQLILTIGKARTFDKFLPPATLSAFDAEKIAFIPYNDIHDVFYQNDFNWNVTPSNHETKEFKQVYDKVKDIIDKNALLFYYDRDSLEIEGFIQNNFIAGKFGFTKIRIDKNNFMVIYTKWLQTVKPTIAVNWEIAKENGIIDGDFYLADLLSYENETLKEKLFVLLKKDKYELYRKIDELGLFNSKMASFSDNQKVHNQFWNKYERPPKEEYWDYIVERRDLLVPQDVRERKGSFFTPQIWVAKSQEYLSNVLGKDWQDEYYIWDCAAGTGNLLANLTNKYRIWASTLDRQDVDVMHDRIETMNENSIDGNGSNLLDSHVFQFDFLNDDFSTLPESLQDVINNPKKCKKLIIYINPPYAEATTARTVTGTGENKAGVATSNKTNQYFKTKIGNASNELSALFIAQIYYKIPDATLGLFSTIKFIQGTNFRKFKDYFLAKYLDGFVVPSNTFDNVKGKFPIGFTIWDLKIKEKIKDVSCAVFDKNNESDNNKMFHGNLPKSINKWFVQFKFNSNENIGLLSNYPPDFQNQNKVFIQIKQSARSGAIKINDVNLIPISIYFAVRHCIKATWLNDRDQFLYPNDNWQTDTEFQNNCLTYTLFHGQNRIRSTNAGNDWIPFTEYEVGAKDMFRSHFMTDFISGNLEPNIVAEKIFGSEEKPKRTTSLQFSPLAKDVFFAGRDLWKYYHSQQDSNPDAALYDIRLYFQGQSKSGRMNNKSKDETYTKLITSLRDKLKILAKEIQPKVYEYGFLKK